MTETQGDQNGMRMCRPEQLLVHMNPHMDFSDLRRTYPNVSERSFYRWRQEVHQVMNYMRLQPSLQYEEISSILPHISQEAFRLWRHLLMGQEGEEGEPSHKASSTQTPASDVVNVTSCSSSNKETDIEHMARDYQKQAQEKDKDAPTNSGNKSRWQIKDDFVQVMLKPTMDYGEYKATLGRASQRTFYRWRAHIKQWRENLASNPTMTFSDFTRITREVPEYVFQVWREWERQGKPASTSNSQTAPSQASSDRDSAAATIAHQSEQLENLTIAYDLFMRNPHVPFEDLTALYPVVSTDVYQQWKKDIDLKLEYIRQIDDKDFSNFHNLFPDIREDIFNIWKDLVLRQNSMALMQKNFLYPEVSASSSTYQPSTEVNPNPLATSAAAQSFYSVSANEFYQQQAAAYAAAVEEASNQSPHQAISEQPKEQTDTHTSMVEEKSNHMSVDKELDSVEVKAETSPNLPLPSFTESLSNLGDDSAASQTREDHSSVLNVVNDSNGESSNTDPKTNQLSNLSAESSSQIAFPGGYSSSYLTVPGVHGLTSGIMPMTTTPPSVSPNLKLASSPLATTTASYNSSLSQASPKSGNSHPSTPNSAHKAKESKKSNNNSDSPGFSSQRQRKLQRSEYIFLEQNPNVDVQQFMKLFPGVSVRSYYRWKQEIQKSKQEMKGIVLSPQSQSTAVV